MLRYSLVFLCWLMLSTTLNAATNVKSNNKELMTLSYRATDISEVYETLSRQNQVNILLTAGVTGDVSVNLYNVTLDKAIHVIATSAGFAVQRVHGSYIIMPKENVGKDVLGGVTHVRAMKVQYSDVAAVEAILNNYLSRYGKISTLPGRRMLVIEDQPAFINHIERILSEIDKQPIQILIEAKILDINLSENDEFGINWSKTTTETTFGVDGLTTPSTGAFFSLLNKNIDLKLNALIKKGRTRTLSTPKLLAIENKKASVIIGKRLGFKTTTTINQVTTETVEFIDSGIILSVIPSVDNAGRILLDIHPEISDGVLESGIPQLTTTSVTTQLLAEDGQAIFIGGLIKHTVSEVTEGVPILSDIPLLGRLFSNDIDKHSNTETVVIITPHIIRTEKERLGFTNRGGFDELDSLSGKSMHRVNQEFDQQVGIN